eukprot:219138_1
MKPGAGTQICASLNVISALKRQEFGAFVWGNALHATGSGWILEWLTLIVPTQIAFESFVLAFAAIGAAAAVAAVVAAVAAAATVTVVGAAGAVGATAATTTKTRKT